MNAIRLSFAGLFTAIILSNCVALAQDAKVLILRARVPDGITVVRPETWTPNTGTGYVDRTMHDVVQHIIPRYRQHPVGHQDTLPINKAHSWGPAGTLIGFGPDSVLRGTASGVLATGTVESTGTDADTIVFKTISPTPADDALIGMYLRFTDNTATTALRGQWRQIADNTASTAEMSSAFGTTPAEDDAFEVFNPQPIVVTEDFFAPQGMWDGSAGPDTSKAAGIFRPIISDLSILGPAIGGQVATRDYVNAGLVNTFWNSFSGTSGNGVYSNYLDRWHGLFVKGSQFEIDSVQVTYIAGTAIHATVGTSGTGHPRWYDGEASSVRNVTMRHCYRGLLYEDTDGMLEQITATDIRDWGVKITGSAVAINGMIHTWGVFSDDPNAIANDRGIGIWITGNAAMGGPIYPETSQTGLLLDGSGSMLTGFTTLNNTHYSIRVRGSGHSIYNISINNLDAPDLLTGATPVGISNEHQANTFEKVACYSPDNSTCVALKGNDGCYRARFRDLVCVLNSGAKGIVATGTLKRSVIKAHIEENGDSITGTVGLDLSGASIGTSNRIYLTTGNISDGRQPDTIVDWPDSASDWTTTPKNTTNEVYINGRRYYPPVDEF